MLKKRNWYLTFGLILTAVMLLYIVVGFFWTPYEPGSWDGIFSPVHWTEQVQH